MIANTYDKHRDKSSEPHSHITQKNNSKRKAKALNGFECYPTAGREEWTIAKIVDELVIELGSSNSYGINQETGQICITHKYHDQAKWVLYRINIYNPLPEFVISISDLSPKLKEELYSLGADPVERDQVITDAVSRILEATDQQYYHVSGVHSKIRWRLAP
jgi:hypothetical protein